MKVGDKLGRFELVRSLGKGSHGVVFEARDTMLGERVAIKALHPWLSNDETLRERFKRELILTRRVSHPGVCRLYDLHEEGETLFISMQFVEGRTLSQVIKTEAIDDKRCIALMRGICGPLAAAHDAGVTHRDLKPGNVLVGDNDRVVVLDFGIATAAGVGQLTTPGQALGSVPFIPPEVWEGGSASALGDQYALGVIAFASLTRELPYTGKNPMEIVDAIRATTPSLRARAPGVGEALERVILRAIAVKPEDRYASVAALDAALAAVADGAQPSTPTSPSMATPSPVELSADDVDPLTSASSVIELRPSTAVSPSGSGAPGVSNDGAGTVPGFVVPQAVLADVGEATPAAPRSLLVSAVSSPPVLRPADAERVADQASAREPATRPMRASALGVFGDKTAPSPPPVADAPVTEPPLAEPSRTTDDFEQKTAPLSAADLGLSQPSADDLVRSFVSADGFDDGPVAAAGPEPAQPPPSTTREKTRGFAPAPSSTAAREETRGFAPAPSSTAAREETRGFAPAPSSTAAREETRGFAPAPSSSSTESDARVTSPRDVPSAATGAPVIDAGEKRAPARQDATVIVRVRDVDADLAAYENAARSGRARLVALAAVGVVVVAVLAVLLAKGQGDGPAVVDAGDVVVDDVGDVGVDAGVAVAVADAGTAAAADAGTAAAADAGTAAAAVDAGVAVAVAAPGSDVPADAGELVIDDLIADAGVAVEPRKTGGGGGGGGGSTVVGDAGPDAATLAAWKQVQAQAKTRGLRTGDAPAFDAASTKAQAAVKGRNRAALAAAVTAAKAALDAVVVDRAFVSEKLARFNRAFDGKDPALKEQLKPLTKDVLAKIGKKDWTGANTTLNEGFARLAKGR